MLVDVAFQQLTSSGFMSATFKATQPGYAYIYVSNEEQYQRDVYFDDVTMTLTPSPVVETTDYYPFGLTFNSYYRESSVPQNYKFNGIEQVSDLGLNILDAKFRVLDPAIGRWWQIDPKVDKNHFISPYNSMANNPVSHLDPLGDDDYVSYGDGKVKRIETKDKFNRYYHQDDKGKQTLLGQYNLNKNGLLDMSGGSGKGWTKALDNKKNYLDPKAASAFLTSAFLYNQETGKTVKVNQFSTEEGSHFPSQRSLRFGTPRHFTTVNFFNKILNWCSQQR